MAKALHDDVFDGALNILKNNGNELVLCSAEPTTYTEAHTTYMLLTQTVDSSDYTLANGDVSGRKVTVSAQSGLTPSANGTATYVAITDTNNSKLLAITTCPSKTFTTSDTINIAAFDLEFRDPT